MMMGAAACPSKSLAAKHVNMMLCHQSDVSQLERIGASHRDPTMALSAKHIQCQRSRFLSQPQFVRSNDCNSETMGILISLLLAPFNIPECIVTALGEGYSFGFAFVECFFSLGDVDNEISKKNDRRLLLSFEGIRGTPHSDIDWSAFRIEEDEQDASQ